MGQWFDSWDDIRVAFLGRGYHRSQEDALRAMEHAPVDLSWLRQIHSSQIVPASRGLCGEADGLITAETELALNVYTADCVPVLVAHPTRIAAVHVGWRGFAADILGNTLRAMVSVEKLRVWVGPAIGPCCYEVGEDVARAVEKWSPIPIRHPGSGPRPHVDLPGAVEAVFRHAGVQEIRHMRRCTSCNEKLLWSYRRDGAGGGRNHSFVWRSAI